MMMPTDLLTNVLPIGADPLPPVAYRFAVIFMNGKSDPNLIDIRFKKASGFNAEIETMTVNEGGQNSYSQQLPTRIKHSNLVLERGLLLFSPIAAEFNKVMTQFRFSTSQVLVALLDDASAPLAAWQFHKAYPVKWSTTELNAESNSVVIDTLELAHSGFQQVKM